MTARWYVLHVYSGSEKKVAESIKEQAVLKKMEDKILDVLVPTEDAERLVKLNQIAIHQMSVLESGDNDRKLLK